MHIAVKLLRYVTRLGGEAPRHRVEGFSALLSVSRTGRAGREGWLPKEAAAELLIGHRGSGNNRDGLP
jgi:hypothetical protein